MWPVKMENCMHFVLIAQELFGHNKYILYITSDLSLYVILDNCFLTDVSFSFSSKLMGPVFSSPAVDTQNDMVFVADVKHWIYAFSSFGSLVILLTDSLENSNNGTDI
jgi:hypothetical protein